MNATTEPLPTRPRLDAVPEHAARLAAALTALSLLAVLLGAPPWLLLWLLPDFLARAADRRHLSLSGVLARTLLAPNELPVHVSPTHTRLSNGKSSKRPTPISRSGMRSAAALAICRNEDRTLAIAGSIENVVSTTK